MTAHRVLVVDDNRLAADLVAKLLTNMGYEAKSTYDGASTLMLVDVFKPEVVFVDLVMPDMDGIELGRQLRAKLGPTVKTVALSAFGDDKIQAATAAAGFNGHLTKPATAEMLAQALSG